MVKLVVTAEDEFDFRDDGYYRVFGLSKQTEKEVLKSKSHVIFISNFPGRSETFMY